MGGRRRACPRHTHGTGCADAAGMTSHQLLGMATTVACSPGFPSALLQDQPADTGIPLAPLPQGLASSHPAACRPARPRAASFGGGSPAAGAAGGPPQLTLPIAGAPGGPALEGLRGLGEALSLVEAALSVGQHLPQLLLYRWGRRRGAVRERGGADESARLGAATPAWRHTLFLAAAAGAGARAANAPRPAPPKRLCGSRHANARLQGHPGDGPKRARGLPAGPRGAATLRGWFGRRLRARLPRAKPPRGTARRPAPHALCAAAPRGRGQPGHCPQRRREPRSWGAAGRMGRRG
jgi:hypothetical protein